ncbi:hypothetical protein ABZ897_00870 [Nonomuraea sp. NPDC046802]|uniref:hypothetical protein n=1 Tax=Nonomuraea sp. NPDC046802 TaxID=3154919 RepID=UPI0033D6B28A
MADVDLDFSELLPVAAEIEREAHEVAQEAYPVVKKMAVKLQRDWRRNARSSAGAHGKHYPRSITSEQRFSTDGPDWEIGPDKAMPQGGMGRGFEWGSVHQPPHNDMGQAMATLEPLFEAAAKKIADGFMS